uniref:fatty acid amide hydrolase n=1 Tax=Plectus sambesii TaxID=2011161 RepID=A0A914V9B0_9BILA
MWWILALIGVLTAIYWLRRRSARGRQVAKLQMAIERRVEERQRSIDGVRKSLDSIDASVRSAIQTLSFSQLVESLQEGKYSAAQALRAYQEKAIAAHEKTNCLTLFIHEAESWAAELDEKAKSSDYKKPPLFGIPVSIKECVNVKGYDQTRGYAQGLGDQAKEDAMIVSHLKALGAVPFVLTNVPQSLLSYACSNPIYGTTGNPYDPTKVPGGSSGGESALIASGGSPLGIGGDVGGSIRIPCHFTGIAGIKPSHIRLSHRGTRGSVPGRPLINASDGPMAADVDTCAFMLRHMWTGDWLFSRDPYVAPVPWREEIYSSERKLIIGYYDDDKWFLPTPALRRAVQEAKEILEKAGHRLIRFDPPDVSAAFSHFVSAVSVDGGTYLLNRLDNDILDDTYKPIVRLYRIPLLVQRALSYLLRPIYPRLATALRCMPRNTAELRLVYERIELYRERFTRQMEQLGLDAIICPVQVMPAVPHDVPMKVFATVSYTGLFNLLDYAAGVVRVTEVSEEDEQALENYPVNDPWDKVVKEASKGAVGLPIAVQCVAPPFREEICLRVMREIETGVRTKTNRKH